MHIELKCYKIYVDSAIVNMNINTISSYYSYILNTHIFFQTYQDVNYRQGKPIRKRISKRTSLIDKFTPKRKNPLRKKGR
jgi:hypothetical protein